MPYLYLLCRIQPRGFSLLPWDNQPRPIYPASPYWSRVVPHPMP